MSRSSEQYLSTIGDLTGGGGHVYDMTDSGEAPVLVAAYDDVPRAGYMTAFTFGLSSAEHHEWSQSKPELMISVRSVDHAWALRMGEIVRDNRYSALFEYGNILHCRERIVADCPLTSFLVFASCLLDGTQRTVKLPDREVSIAQIYPIYESEAQMIGEIGVERFFWELGIDFSSLSRMAVALN